MRYNKSREEWMSLEKTATLNLRVNPDVKKNAETILAQLGVPMATAVDMFLKQVALTGGIPFAITLPKAPASINADLMSLSEIREKLRDGFADIESGNVTPAREAFRKFVESRSDEKVE
jgi:addiction module RelB/DinJ family antitoxin